MATSLNSPFSRPSCAIDVDVDATIENLRQSLKQEPIYIADNPTGFEIDDILEGGASTPKKKPRIIIPATTKILDDGLRDVYGQHPLITKWAHDRQDWYDKQVQPVDVTSYMVPPPCFERINAAIQSPKLLPMIVDSGRRNGAGINPDLAKWFQRKSAWEKDNFPRLYTKPQPVVMTIEEIYPPTNEDIVSSVYGSTTKHPPTTVLRDIFEEYLTTKELATYMQKTLTTPLKYTFLYMRGELVRDDMGNFLQEYMNNCEPWLLVPPAPHCPFLEEIAFVTKYLIYDIDKKENGVVRNFTRGLFGTTPKVGMFKKIGRWLNSHSFVSAKGTFGFDPNTDKVNFGCINTFIA